MNNNNNAIATAACQQPITQGFIGLFPVTTLQAHYLPAL
jgi:hypothetical protein